MTVADVAENLTPKTINGDAQTSLDNLIQALDMAKEKQRSPEDADEEVKDESTSANNLKMMNDDTSLFLPYRRPSSKKSSQVASISLPDSGEEGSGSSHSVKITFEFTATKLVQSVPAQPVITRQAFISTGGLVDTVSCDDSAATVSPIESGAPTTLVDNSSIEMVSNVISDSIIGVPISAPTSNPSSGSNSSRDIAASSGQKWMEVIPADNGVSLSSESTVDRTMSRTTALPDDSIRPSSIKETEHRSNQALVEIRPSPSNVIVADVYDHHRPSSSLMGVGPSPISTNNEFNSSSMSKPHTMLTRSKAGF
ncbi:hypothetical protein NE237_019558 [Protea cynaroides]|uniref:AAA+ ATPase At3g28540-like C-terminal domain-containing protein n=1 Tax=Protea cynaroides TaxID=273540 RepID=A0A9Q0H7C8_9MAGN|nr:hypothetical protein NE237_019558 [Protea cynaroides]